MEVLESRSGSLEYCLSASVATWKLTKKVSQSTLERGTLGCINDRVHNHLLLAVASEGVAVGLAVYDNTRPLVANDVDEGAMNVRILCSEVQSEVESKSGWVKYVRRRLCKDCCIRK